jgi:enoyl-CoA hydratase/carnithine racemase
MKELVELKINTEKRYVVMVLKQIVFDIPLVREINDKLNEIEKIEGPLCLITTSDHNKTYSAGLNFQVFAQHYQDVHNFICEFCRLLARFMALPFPTIAALNGHFLAGGFMFAMSHDLRISLDSDTIKLGMTEINLGMTIPKPMMAPLLAKMNKVALREINLFGKIMNPKQALEFKIVDQLVSADVLRESCKVAERLAILGENRLAYGGIKRNLYQKYIDMANDGSPDPVAEKIINKVNNKL